MLDAALLDGPRGLAAWEKLRSGLDLATVDYTAQAVLPLLYRRLRAAGIDDPLMGLFKGIHRYNWARNQALLEGFVPILRRLVDAGIATALLKGASLVTTAYADAGLRAMQDLDVLVPTAQRRAAIDVLDEAGLVPVSGFSPDAVDHLGPSFTPSFGFRDAQGREIDLHWNLLHQSRQPDADDDFWAAMRTVSFRGLALGTLDPADQLLHAIAHGLRWNQMPPLRWVLDSMTLLRQPAAGLDPMRLVEQAQRRRLVVPVRQALDYLRQRYDAPVPEAALAALRRSPTSFLERREARIEAADPARQRPVDRALLEFQDAVRRRTPLGRRPGWRIHLAAMAACRGLDAVRQLPADLLLGRPGLPHHPAAGSTAVLAEGAVLPTTSAASFYRVAGHGWTTPEPHGTWSIRRRAQLRLMLTERSGLPLALSFAGRPFGADGVSGQRLAVLINGRRVAQWPGAPTLQPARIVLPPAAAAASVIDLRFCVASLGSPHQLDLGADVRSLGFFLGWLSVAPLPALWPGKTLDFAAGVTADPFLADGWRRTADGADFDDSARLVLRLAARPAGRLRLTATLAALPGRAPPARLLLAVNRRAVADWPAPVESDGWVTLSTVMPDRLLGDDGAAAVEFRMADPGPRPAAARSGICLRALTIEAAP